MLTFPFRSRSTRTSSSSLFRFLDARVVRRTFCITRLFSYLFESWRAERRSRERARRVLLVSISLFLRLLASLIMYLIPSRSVYLLRDLRVSFLLSLDLTQIPRITQMWWLKPSGTTTDKRNPVLGDKTLPSYYGRYMPRETVPSLLPPAFFRCFVTEKRAACTSNAYGCPPFLYTRPHMRLYAYATFFFLLLLNHPSRRVDVQEPLGKENLP